MTVQRPILFYDGECGFCQRTVQWALRHDRHRRLWFAPLQGTTYRSLAPAGAPVDLSTIVFLAPQGMRMRSSAIVALLTALGGAWRALGVLLWLVPRPVRDAGYGFVARRRHRLGGRNAACAVPGPADRERFLP